MSSLLATDVLFEMPTWLRYRSTFRPRARPWTSARVLFASLVGARRLNDYLPFSMNRRFP
jgi:hypothetical protein